MSADSIGSFQRLRGQGEAQRVPVAIPERPGHFDVDATWGTVQPLMLHPAIETVAEHELVAHIEAGLPIVDTRSAEVAAQGTIRGARVISHHDLPERAGEIDRETTTVLFCNGPQCAATPSAVETLLAGGHPPAKLRYYRGGIRDWVTLGLPLEPPAA